VTKKQFVDNIKVFNGDKEQLDLESVARTYERQERRLAKLNHCQSVYNHAVKVRVAGNDCTLDDAIKLTGGAGRIDKLWRLALQGGEEVQGRYRFMRTNNPTERDKDKEYAVRNKSVEFCLDKVTKAAQFAAAVREAVHTGNTVEVEIPELEDKDLTEIS
jgi:hypothetical protein